MKKKKQKISHSASTVMAFLKDYGWNVALFKDKKKALLGKTATKKTSAPKTSGVKAAAVKKKKSSK